MTTSHTCSALLSMKLVAQMTRGGEQLTSEDIYALQLVRAYADALLKGEPTDGASIYHKAFNGQHIKPEEAA